MRIAFSLMILASLSIWILPCAVTAETSSHSEQGNTFQTGNWSGRANYNETSGAFLHCDISTSPKRGFLLSFITHRGDFVMTVLNESWQLPGDTIYEVELQIDDGAVQRYRAKTYSGSGIILRLGSNNDAIAALKNGRFLNLGTAQRRYRLNLEGSAAALTRVARCDQEHSRYATTTPSARSTDQGTAITTNPSAPSEQQAVSFPPNENTGLPDTPQQIREIPGLADYTNMISALAKSFLDTSEHSHTVNRLSISYLKGTYSRTYTEAEGKKILGRLTEKYLELLVSTASLPPPPKATDPILQEHLNNLAGLLDTIRNAARNDISFSAKLWRAALDDNDDLEYLQAHGKLRASSLEYRKVAQELEDALLDTHLSSSSFYQSLAMQYSSLAVVDGLEAYMMRHTKDADVVEFLDRAQGNLERARAAVASGEHSIVQFRVTLDGLYDEAGNIRSLREKLETLTLMTDYSEKVLNLESLLVQEVSQFTLLVRRHGSLTPEQFDAFAQNVESIERQRADILTKHQELSAIFQ